MDLQAPPRSDNIEPIKLPPLRWNTEDWWAVLIGAVVLVAMLLLVWATRPDNLDQRLAALAAANDRLAESLRQPATTKAVQDERAKLKEDVAKKEAALAPNPLKAFPTELGSWKSDPAAALKSKTGVSVLPGVGGMFCALLVLLGVACVAQGRPAAQWLPGYVVLFLLSLFSFLLAGQEVVKHYNLEYALWALFVGLAISNTVGTPRFLLAAANTEFYIKTGLVLLGAEVLFNRLLDLGLPGMFVAWITTPFVLITTYIFGQRFLKIPSRSLNMVICADMSVCGVSAAIATGAACKAKKEEISLAVGLSLAFTVVMMVVMPLFIRYVGMSDVLGGAWIGGTIDSTGAVAAAGGALTPAALEVAVTVKMIQNILIGAIAFGVAVYWVTYVERRAGEPTVGVSEIWRRFPRFILGFVAASIAFSLLDGNGPVGNAMAEAVTGTTKSVRNWLFCLAFVSIGLESNFRDLARHMAGGKPLILYIVGQTLNLAMTLLMAWIMFEKVFPDAAAGLAR